MSVEKEKKETSVLEAKDMSSLLYLLITRLGGHVQVEHRLFEQLRMGGGAAPIERIYDTDKDMWHFIAVGSKKVKSKQIITPSRNVVRAGNVI